MVKSVINWVVSKAVRIYIKIRGLFSLPARKERDEPSINELLDNASGLMKTLEGLTL